MKITSAAILLSALAMPALAQDLPDRPVRRQEVIAAVTSQFKAIDTNHDGIVTRAEFDRFRESPAGQAAAASSNPINHVGSHWFDHADPDGSGRVSLQMAEAHPLQMFDMADINHDGVIGPDEMRMAQAMRSLAGH